MAKGTTKAMIERLSARGYEVVVMSVYASEQQSCEKRAHAAIRFPGIKPVANQVDDPVAVAAGPR